MQMKSTNVDEMNFVLHTRRRRILSRSDFIHRRWIYSGRRTDFVEKKQPLSYDKGCFFSVKYIPGGICEMRFAM